MRVFDSMEVAGSSLTAHRLWMDTISSNLANINTTRTLDGGPYKRKVPVFAEMLDKSLDGYREINGVRVLAIAEDNAAPRMTYQPDHPDANADGYVAYPNVNLVREMTDMLVASRAYEANLSVVTTGRDMWNNALEVMRG
ncbi:MAG: flagellar basal body rod protein FlgC [Synergistaceae bacterium]|nr:flagellar basal body rod protein FlgC [Synergistaceae bacterium]MBQ3627174.1 flagellar basal body rod protein FlgC [Synergistaceae bacterium]MBQ6740595.1 flagellar basal body rod protein FlgC [Synergistaceae bacterium]MBQ9896344.1 flagellar basal body rod protein FlgC [Synergistaceae bacterium]MBR0044606.1 flagellar basal body rod protein FlgC [Synergistaceae bacterium]